MDSAPGVFFTGYPYFLEKFRRQRRDILETRLMFMKAIAMRGEEAARLFYDETRFMRKGAMPKRVQKTLVGERGVQLLDNAHHLHRKALFMQVMNDASLHRLEAIFSKHWNECMQHWSGRKDVVLFKEAEMVLFRSACEWVGIPIEESDVKPKTELLSAMIDAPAAIGLRHMRGRWGRRKSEAWISSMVDDVRNGRMIVSESSIMYIFSMYREPDGSFPDNKTTAVEIINLIRPIVAIARYIVFAALALHEHPQYQEKLKNTFLFRNILYTR